MTEKNHNTQKTNNPTLDPLLDKRLKDNPLSVPERFFTDQREQILNKTVMQNAEMASGKEQIFLLKPGFLWPVTAVAAVVLLFIILVNTGDHNQEEDYFSGITVEQVMEENPEYLYTMDEAGFYDAISLTSSDWDPGSVPVELYLDTGTSDEAIQEYLIEEEVSIELLNL